MADLAPDLFALHRQRQCQLRSLCAQLGEERSQASRQPADTAALSAALHHQLALWQSDLLDGLFPALCEAVAGSDPVCIRAMRDDVAAQLQEVARAWRVASVAAPPAHEEMAALRGVCESLLAALNTLVWPMAERLLDAPALAALQAAQRTREA